jgi:hypothetical protein
MKKILLMMPSYYGFDEVITEGLKKYSGCSVHSIDTSFKLAYRNIYERILNFLSKVFLHKNLKPKMRERLILDLIGDATYDFLIVNRADLISGRILEKSIKQSKNAILLLWDNLSRYPIDKGTIAMFDNVYSFDNADCITYGFQKIENFHFFEALPKIGIKYDAVFFGSLDARIDHLKNILNYLNENDKNGHAYINVPRGKSLIKHPNIEIMHAVIPYKDSYKYSMTGKVIIDLGQKSQSGLSFRFFEAMAFKKKVITTNNKVSNYDFYNENNIFIIKDINHLAIPESFWKSPYEQPPQHILEKYHIKNWVKRILSEK